MKAAIWIPVALLVGFLLGGWGPRAQLRKDREELDRLRRSVRSDTRRGGGMNNPVVEFLRLGETRAGHGNRTDGVSGTNAVTGGAGHVAGPSSTNAGGMDRRGWMGETGRPPFSLKQGIEDAAEIWKIRSDIARSGFVKATRLNPEQTVQFDVLMEAMNMRLKDRISDWAEVLKSDAPLTPETGIRMVNDLSDVLVVTYEEMDRTLPPEWREKSGPEFDLGSFIDPTVATPLVEVEGKFQEAGRARRASGGWRGRPMGGGLPVQPQP